MSPTRLAGHRRRCITSALTLAVTVLGLVAAPALASNAACPDATSSTGSSCTFTNAGTPIFTVPANVESIDVVAVGAAGGAASTINHSPAAAGGAGASVQDASVPVLTGSGLKVVVGGLGQGAAFQSNAAGGSPGGGGAGGTIPGPFYVSGAGGGGFSGLLDASSTPLVIAGGGGGAAGFACSGSGGGGAGDTGSGGATGGQCSNDGGTGGTGGSATAAGQAGGSGNCPNTAGTTYAAAGSSLQGGHGAAAPNSATGAGFGGGGGGGGGYYGGGGGGSCADGGGGGGGSYGITGLTNEKLATEPASVTISWAQPASFLRSLGKTGSGNGQFSTPQGITVISTPGGPVTFVADSGNHRLESFAPDGGFLDSYPVSGNPVGVAGDFSNGYLYAAEPNAGQLEILSLDGTSELTVPLASPTGVAADPLDGTAYVTDPGSGQVYKINGADGAQLGAFSATGNGGTLGEPTGVVFDQATGELYVADAKYDDIVVYDSSGNYLRHFARAGTGPGQLRHPASVALDPSSGEVFVVDAGNDRVERFRPDGTFTGEWGSYGSGYGQFAGPWGIAFAPDGSFYVSDSRHNRIEKFGFPGPLSHFVISALPAWEHTNTPRTVTLTAEDASGNVISTYSASPSWQDSIGQMTGGPAPFSGGVSTNSLSLTSPAHHDQITVTDGSVVSKSRTFSVVGPLAKFAIDGPGSGSAGASSTVSIVAQDSIGQTIPDYAGSPGWSDVSGQVSGSPASFVQGRSTNTVTFANPVRDDRITVSDGAVSSHSASTFSRVGPVARFALTTPYSMPAGSPLTLTLTAFDSAGNRVSGYAGSPTWSDSSGQITGSPTAFSGGVSHSAVTFAQPVHNDVITVRIASASFMTKMFSVVGAPAKFIVHVPPTATHGTPFTVTVTVEDALGSVIKSYAGTPTWTDTSGQLTGSPASFSGGVSTNNVTLANPVAKDRIQVSAGAVTGQSSTFAVN